MKEEKNKGKNQGREEDDDDGRSKEGRRQRGKQTDRHIGRYLNK